MKKLIRNQCFETNSSSCHSITISDAEGFYSTIIPNEEGVIEVEAQDFGWEIEDYTSPHEKLCYLLLYLRDWVSDDESKAKFKATLEKVVQEQTQAEKIILKDKNPGYPWDNGGIDHQSVESRDLDYIFQSEELMKNFIFNPKSILHTDNDNH